MHLKREGIACLRVSRQATELGYQASVNIEPARAVFVGYKLRTAIGKRRVNRSAIIYLVFL